MWITSPSSVRSRVCRSEVLDDALQLVHQDLDRVADRVPALDEHGEPGDDVHQDSLHREADQDQDEGRTSGAVRRSTPPISWPTERIAAVANPR